MYCIHVPGLDPLIFSFRSFFLFDWVGVLWPQLSKVLKPVRWPAASLISLMVSVDVKHHDYLLAASLSLQCPCRGRLFVCCCGRCSCVHLRGEPTLFPGWCDSSASNPARKRQVCRGVGWGVEGSRLEAWMKSHKSEVAIT